MAGLRRLNSRRVWGGLGLMMMAMIVLTGVIMWKMLRWITSDPREKRFASPNSNLAILALALFALHQQRRLSHERQDDYDSNELWEGSFDTESPQRLECRSREFDIHG